MTGSHLQPFYGVLLLIEPTFEKSYTVFVLLILRIEKVPLVSKIRNSGPELVDDGVEIIQLHPMVVRPRIQRTDVVVELSELRNVTLLEYAKRLFILLTLQEIIRHILNRNVE